MAVGNTAGTYSILATSGTTASPGISFQSDTDSGFIVRGSNNFGAVAGTLPIVTFANLSGTPVMAMINTTTARFYSGDGTAALPGITYENDTNTGIYRAGADSVGISVGGSGNLIVDSLRVTVPTGSIINPSLVFSGENTAGISRPLASTIGISIGSATSSLFTANGIRTPDGTAALPAYSFYSDTNTGLYLGAADALVVSAGGLSSAVFTPSGVRTPDGTLALPAHSFFNDTDTGLYLPALDTIAVSTGGATSAVFNTSGIDLVDGSLASPAYSFLSDTDTGIYRVGSGRVGIVSNGTLFTNFLSNESDIQQNRAQATASNNVYYHYAMATSGGEGRWKLGVASDGTTFRLDRWSGGSFVEKGLEISSATATFYSGGATAVVFNTSGMRIPGITSSLLATDSKGQITATQSPFRFYASSSQGATVSNTTSELITYQQLIPANTFKTGDVIELMGLAGWANTTYTRVLRINGSTASGTLGGALPTPNTRLAQGASSAARVLGIQRHFWIYDATGAGEGTMNYPTSPNSPDDTTTGGGGQPTSFAIDWTKDYYITFALQQVNILDTGRGASFYIRKLN